MSAAGALRRGIHTGAQRRLAPGDILLASSLPRARGGGADGRVVVAHGLRPRPVPGVQGHEDVVHSQGEAWWRGEAIRVMMETCAAGARHGGTERGHGQEL